MEPFDYTMPGAINPVDAMFGGMQFGQQQRAGEQQMALANSQEQRAQTQFGQENIMFDQAQQDRAEAIKAAIEAKNAAAKLQTDLVGLAGKVAAGTATHADFTAISLAHPELTNEMKMMWDGQTAERKSADVANLYKVSAALKAGKPDIAITMFEDRAEAADAAGDKQEADISRAMAAGIKADPASALATLGLLLQSVDDKASIELFGLPKTDLTTSQKDYNFYAKQEADAGRVPKSFEAWETQGKKAGATTVNVNPNSTDGTPKVGPSLSEMQTSVDSAVTLIDEIANDPALPGVTGPIEGGGGNAVDEFGVAKRMYYGGEGLATIQKIAQLQNTAWLAARDMLKGGGAITDYESKKAEGAMARLSRAQGDEEFKAALKDLRDAITEGAAKLKAAGIAPASGSGSPVAPTAEAAPPSKSLDDLLKEAEGL